MMFLDSAPEHVRGGRSRNDATGINQTSLKKGSGCHKAVIQFLYRCATSNEGRNKARH